MRILIIGVSGMLGHKLYQGLKSDLEVVGTIRSTFDSVSRFDLLDKRSIFENVDVCALPSVEKVIEKATPDVVINAAGVIKQNPTSEDVVKTLRVNSVFPQHLAGLSSKYNFRLITISTDCVFSGDKGHYAETDIPDAGDLYGISKLLGEAEGENCLTVRTSIIGRELSSKRGLVEWFLSNRGKTVKGYVSAIYSGFTTFVLTDILAKIVTDNPGLKGVYHVSSDPISKFDLLCLLNKHYQAGVTIEPFEEFVIDRSLDSSLFRKVTGFSPLSWEQMVEQMASDPTPYETWKK